MIGIITFHASHNCGSILQAYALQKVLQTKLQYESEIIDFSNEGQRNYYSVFVKNDSIKHFVKNVVTTFFYGKAKEENRVYEEYIHNTLKLSQESYRETNELEGIEKRYSALICGSDQVWNVTCTDADDAYFLSFAKNTKKIAYATSLGAKNINRYTKSPDLYKKYILDFDAVSVREGNGQKWIESLVDQKIDVSICLDPTLLLSREEWEKKTPARIIREDYIFYYAFNYIPEVNQVVKEISQKFNMPVYMFDVKSWGVKGNFRYGFRIADAYGPEAFLSLIKNAKMVLTTSFHGTVFSTVYQKNFWYLNSSMHSKDDDRASYLLGQLGLESRLISLESAGNMDLTIAPDYEISNARVETLRKFSLTFIRNSLRDNYE